VFCFVDHNMNGHLVIWLNQVFNYTSFLTWWNFHILLDHVCILFGVPLLYQRSPCCPYYFMVRRTPSKIFRVTASTLVPLHYTTVRCDKVVFHWRSRTAPVGCLATDQMAHARFNHLVPALYSRPTDVQECSVGRWPHCYQSTNQSVYLKQHNPLGQA